MKGPTWNDLRNATPSELKKTYKMNDRQLEQGVRQHLQGADASERRQVYETVYNLKDKS